MANSSSSWRRTFDFIDKNASGYITIDELRSSLSLLDQSSFAAIDDFLKQRNHTEGDERLYFKDFLQLVSTEDTRTIDSAEILQIFTAVDLDCSGYVTAAELRHMLSNLCIAMTDDEMASLVTMYDLDGNGQISIDEFTLILKDLGLNVNREKGLKSSSSNTFQKPRGTQKIHAAQIPSPPSNEESVVLDSVLNLDLREILGLLDKNGTGCISLKALKSAIQADDLHWRESPERRGLGNLLVKVNHIALIVSDVGRSNAFYVNVMGFQQIRRPNFDRHGAWLTLGNCELHLIKGNAVAHSGDDLIVGHISMETQDIAQVAARLRAMNVPYRQNVSVPKGKDAGLGTNEDSESNAIVRQYFVRDPDGYYIEICNCEVLTTYCLGEKSELDGYMEGVKPLTVENALNTIHLMQEWSEKGKKEVGFLKQMESAVQNTDGSIGAIAALLKCEAENIVDPVLLSNFEVRMSVYGDVCQNETRNSLKEILLASGNNARKAVMIMRLRMQYKHENCVRAPGYYEDGVFVQPKTSTIS